MPPEHLPRYPAPAKLNLDLRITGRRADGYHLLESLFVLIDWQDTLRIAPRADGQIVLHTPLPDVPPQQDLCVRAALALQQFSGSPLGADIWLDKQLPMGGGLGGGSSDAATVLTVLNRLWQTGLTAPQLAALGLNLGADVPFFLFGRSAFARGIGEDLQAADVPPQWFVLVCPNTRVSTPAVFAHPELPRNSTPFSGSLNTLWQTLPPLRNDMQDTVLRTYPAVADAFSRMSRFGTPRLTGSGACLFLDGLTETAANQTAQALSTDLNARAVRLLPRHPLQEIFPQTA